MKFPVNSHVSKLVELALQEDIGFGDVTSQFFVPAERQVRAEVTARKDGVISGAELAAHVFELIDPELTLELLIGSGKAVKTGDVILRVSGCARSILTAERTALNFIQRLSGVATMTARFVREVAGTQACILDTRKTTPGFRYLEKQAVSDGGGMNHRMGLYDRAMVKDNHLVSEHRITSLIASISDLKSAYPATEIELEVDHLEQLKEFLPLENVDYILLDNMSDELMRQAVELRGAAIKPYLEASGGVTLERIKSIAATGVDFISVGALTHSAIALDIGLDFTSL